MSKFCKTCRFFTRATSEGSGWCRYNERCVALCDDWNPETRGCTEWEEISEERVFIGLTKSDLERLLCAGRPHHVDATLAWEVVRGWEGQFKPPLPAGLARKLTAAVWEMVTHQTFCTSQLRDALDAELQKEFTDEAQTDA